VDISLKDDVTICSVFPSWQQVYTKEGVAARLKLKQCNVSSMYFFNADDHPSERLDNMDNKKLLTDKTLLDYKPSKNTS
jgi:hypothetical protein